MDFVELLSFVGFIIIVVASLAGSKNKKGSKRAADRRATPVRGKPTVNAARSAPKKQVQKGSAAQGEDPCHEYMLGPREPQMHYHDVDNATMMEAGEGEDPCHVGEAVSEKTTNRDYDLPHRGPAIQLTQSSVAQGIILSEILKRPSQRRQERSMRRIRKGVYG